MFHALSLKCKRAQKIQIDESYWIRQEVSSAKYLDIVRLVLLCRVEYNNHLVFPGLDQAMKTRARAKLKPDTFKSYIELSQAEPELDPSLLLTHRTLYTF